MWCIGSVVFVGAALAHHTSPGGVSVAAAALGGILSAFVLAFWLYAHARARAALAARLPRRGACASLGEGEKTPLLLALREARASAPPLFSRSRPGGAGRAFRYTRVFGVTEMPMLNFLSIFVLLGIGADDVLVVTDTFRLVSTEAATKDKPCSVRMTEALHIAGSAMLVTSVTSAASFYANLASVLPALRSFGVFMGTVIVTNYVMVIVAFPPILVLRDHAQKQQLKDAEEQKRKGKGFFKRRPRPATA